jgi:hypothetical protein
MVGVKTSRLGKEFQRDAPVGAKEEFGWHAKEGGR